MTFRRIDAEIKINSSPFPNPPCSGYKTKILSFLKHKILDDEITDAWSIFVMAKDQFTTKSLQFNSWILYSDIIFTLD